MIYFKDLRMIDSDFKRDSENSDNFSSSIFYHWNLKILQSSCGIHQNKTSIFFLILS